MNTPVSFEIAKLLKEKGFDEICQKWYSVEGSLYYQDEFDNNRGFIPACQCEAPTIAEAVMWLYEKYGIWINVSITIHKEYFYQCMDTTGKKDPTKNNYPSRICEPGNYYNSPTEAYEAAIEYTLNNLI